MESVEATPADSSRSPKPTDYRAKPDCLLTVGSQRFAAILADQSSTGLTVQIQGSPLFWVEDTGVLQTADLEIAVRVSNIVRIEGIDDHFASSVPGFCIGLTPVGQTATKSGPQPPAPSRKKRRKLLSILPLPRIRVSMGGLMGFAMLATPLVLVFVAWQHHVRQVQTVDSQTMAVPGPAEVPQPTPTVTSQPAVPATPEPTPETLSVPGVEPFLNPLVAAKLALTPSQTGALKRLNKTIRAALQDLDKYWESVGRLELARRRGELLDAARQEALQLLTDEQRQKWEAMTR